jgi:hypothetical protein
MICLDLLFRFESYELLFRVWDFNSYKLLFKYLYAFTNLLIWLFGPFSSVVEEL